jgi:hypothetical protein
VLSPLNYAGAARHREVSSVWYPWRESNSHPQLRKLSLFPLSYRGLARRASAPNSANGAGKGWAARGSNPEFKGKSQE